MLLVVIAEKDELIPWDFLYHSYKNQIFLEKINNSNI